MYDEKYKGDKNKDGLEHGKGEKLYASGDLYRG